MNVRDELKKIIGDDADKLDQILGLMQPSAMQKYRQTEKGKLAQKRAAAKYVAKKQEVDTAEALKNIKLTRTMYCKLFPADIERCTTYVDKSGKKHYNLDAAIIAV